MSQSEGIWNNGIKEGPHEEVTAELNPELWKQPTT